MRARMCKRGALMRQAAMITAGVSLAVLLCCCAAAAADATQQETDDPQNLALNVWGDDVLMAAGGFSLGPSSMGRGLQAATVAQTSHSPKPSPAPSPSASPSSPTPRPVVSSVPVKISTPSSTVTSQLPLPLPKAPPSPHPQATSGTTSNSSSVRQPTTPALQKRSVGQLLRKVAAAALRRSGNTALSRSPAFTSTPQQRPRPSPSPAASRAIPTTTSTKPAAATQHNTAVPLSTSSAKSPTAPAPSGNFSAVATAGHKNVSVNLPLYQHPDLPPGCSLAQWMLNKCPAAPSPSPPPSLMANASAAAPYKTFKIKAYNDTCNATLLPNGDFEADKSIDATKLIGWAKIKENSTIGGGGLYNGSTYSYTGWPGPPFNGSSHYFRSRQAGDMAFALVTNAPFTAPTPRSFLSFDWFVDNPWPYWFVSQTTSINANGTDIVIHQARADLYDFDALSPPGNLSNLAEMLFNQTDAAGGSAYLGPVLAPEVAASTPNLMSMATDVPLGLYFGKRLLLAFRYTTNVFYLGFGIDNVVVVDCPKGGPVPVATQDPTLV